MAIDSSRIAQLRELGEQLVSDMLALFLDYVPGRLDALDAAIDAGDTDLARREAHAIKSSAGNIGASALFESARVLEEAAMAGNADALPAMRDQMRANYTAAAERARALIADMAS